MTKEEKTVQEKIAAWREENSKTISWIGTIGLATIVVGFAFSLIGGLSADMYLQFQDDEYLTDDGIAYRDMGNATYTYPVSEFNDRYMDYRLWLYGGIAVMSVGMALVFGMLFVLPSNTESHRIYCKKWESEPVSMHFKYCPECGLKLSRLEKK